MVNGSLTMDGDYIKIKVWIIKNSKVNPIADMTTRFIILFTMMGLKKNALSGN
jgi:hypothetical protein